MKRVVFIILCSLLAVNVINAQIDEKRLYDEIMRKVKAAEAKKLKEREEKVKTEQRHEQQRKQHEVNYNRQINNLNQVSASDFLNSPQQQEGSFSTKVNKFRENQQNPTVVATPKKEKDNRANGNPYGNSGKIGSPSYSGRNYTGNRYDNKRAGFENTQTHVRVSANHIRGQYKSNRNMRQGVVNLQRTNAVPKAKVQTRQQRNTTQSSQQQKSVQTTKKAKDQQKQQSPVQREKVAWVEGGVKHLDTSKPIYITLQQNNSSSDLATVDSRRIDYATEIGNITVYNMPNEAPSMSDRDNKRPSGSVKGLAHDERTQAQQAQLYAKDVANGMSSFDNRKKWEYIYDYGYDRNVKTPARQATKKR